MASLRTRTTPDLSVKLAPLRKAASPAVMTGEATPGSHHGNHTT